MKFKIEHQIKGRVRIHICQKRMTCRQADQLEYFLSGLEGVTAVKVVERNQDAVICYNGDKLAILKAVQKFSYGASEAPESYLQNSGREMNSEYWEKNGKSCCGSLRQEAVPSNAGQNCTYHITFYEIYLEGYPHSCKTQDRSIRT